MNANETAAVAGTENSSRPVRVFFFGASAVSAYAADFASRAGFRCIVLDNAAEKLDNPLLAACERRTVDFENLEAMRLGITEYDMLCVITRGHDFDRQAFAYALGTPAFYKGMMGSAKKNEKCFAYALEHGCTQQQIDAAYAPIGESIGASDACEIGLAICAQLVRVKNERFPREIDHESLHAE